MIIRIADKSLEFTRPILHRVAKKYRALMIHKEIISGKLRELEVLVRWKEAGDRNDGFYRLNSQPERISHYIQLHISPDASEKFIAFAFAHELSHMLLSGSGDYVQLQTTGAEIPPCLQESMADNLAQYIISRCRFSDAGHSYLLRCLDDPYCSEFSELLSLGFGDSLSEAGHIDDFSITPMSAEDFDSDEPAPPSVTDYWETYFSRTDRDCPADLWVHNYFWYLSALGKFSTAAEIFDTYMGKGAFAGVCDDMDIYQCAAQVDVDEAYRAEADMAKQRAFALIQKFVDIRKKEREANGGT